MAEHYDLSNKINHLSSIPYGVTPRSVCFSSVTFNNQNSVLLSKYVGHLNILCLLHDNRIFAFKNSKQPIVSESTSSGEQNLMLNLLTTPRYRAISAMYIVFRFFDMISLLAIVVVNVVSSFEIFNADDGKSVRNLNTSVPTFCVLLIDTFHEVMLSTNRYWMMQRLSIYIGIMLFITYGFLLYVANFTSDVTFIVVIVSIRLGAFLLEEMMDIALDAMLHNDLLEINERSKFKRSNTFDSVSGSIKSDDRLVSNTQSPRIVRENSYCSLPDDFILPSGVEYIGSMSAWGLSSIYDENGWLNVPLSNTFIVALCILPATASVIPLILLLIFCLGASASALILSPVVYAACCFSCGSYGVANFGGKFRNLMREFIEF